MLERLYKYIQQNLHTVLILVSILFYAVLCVVPFLLHNSHPLGYDTGFYRRYLINPFVSIPNTPVPGVDHTIIIPRIFLDIIRFLGLNPDITLYGSYIVILLVFIVTFYYFLREFINKKIALFALVILVISPLQYLSYWFMFYKNFFGLIFFFLTLIFLRKKWFIPSLLCALVIPLSHQSTTIIFLMVLATYFGITFLLKRKILIPELTILVSTLLTYLYLHPHVQQKIDAPPVGIFIEKIDFILISIPLIILTLIGLSKFIKILRQDFILIAFGCISILFPLFSLPYYQRIFLFTYYWLIIGAAIGVQALLESKNDFRKGYDRFSGPILVGLIILQISLLGYQIFKLKPLITQNTITELSKLEELIPAQSSVLTSPRLTPWVQGFTVSKVYAPGILKDTHPSWEWQSYWTGTNQDKIEFLASFPKPLYIFIDEEQKNLFIPNVSCIQKMSNMLYRDDCIK